MKWKWRVRLTEIEEQEVNRKRKNVNGNHDHTTKREVKKIKSKFFSKLNQVFAQSDCKRMAIIGIQLS